MILLIKLFLAHFVGDLKESKDRKIESSPNIY
jgi:hypothetical protein